MSFFILIVSFFFACGTAEKEDTSANTTEPTSEPTSQPTSQPESIPEEEGCASLNTLDECFQCFANENPAGYNAYATAIIGNCYCGNDCADDCYDFCEASSDGSTQPSTECNSCVEAVTGDQTSACVTGFQTECSGDTNCVSFVNAVNTCPPE